MPPKKNQGSAIKSKPKSSAMAQIDDLIGQSEVPAGEKHSELSLQLQKERQDEIDKKYFGQVYTFQEQRNVKAVADARLFTTI